MDNHNSCQVSQKNFIKNDVMEHIKSHIEGTSYACIFCPETFPSKSDCDDHHEKKHLKEKTNSDIIQDKVTQKLDLIKSSKSHHENKRFTEKQNLVEHISSHIEENPFACDVCYKRYPWKGLLVKHLRTHVKPFECDICKRRFPSRLHLEKHIQSHTGEKPFECGICKGKFRYESNRKRHIRTIHAEERQNDYDTCQVSFTRRKHLQGHTSTYDQSSHDVSHETFERKRDLTMYLNYARKNALRTKEQQTFVTDSSDTGNDVVASNSENVLKGICATGNVTIIPVIGNIKLEKEDIDLKYDSEIGVSDVKQSSEDCLDENLQEHISNFGPFSWDVCHKTFERKHDLKTYSRKKSLSQKVQQTFATDSVVALSSENLLKGIDATGNVPVNPIIGNIKSENGDIDLKYDSEIDVPDVKPSFQHCLDDPDVDLKIENIEFKEETF